MTGLLEFRRIYSIMSDCGFSRYDVLKGKVYLGQVFQYRIDVDAGSERWLAQGTDGVIHGWLTPIRTRKAAGEVSARRA